MVFQSNNSQLSPDDGCLASTRNTRKSVGYLPILEVIMIISEFNLILSNESCNLIVSQDYKKKTPEFKRYQWYNWCVKDFREEEQEDVNVRVQIEKRFHNEKREDYLRINVYISSNKSNGDNVTLEQAKLILNALNVKQPCIFGDLK